MKRLSTDAWVSSRAAAPAARRDDPALAPFHHRVHERCRNDATVLVLNFLVSLCMARLISRRCIVTRYLASVWGGGCRPLYFSYHTRQGAICRIDHGPLNALHQIFSSHASAVPEKRANCLMPTV